MTTSQPRTRQEAAMLDPTGLMTFPRPNMPGGLFGSSSRRRPFAISPGGMNANQPAGFQSAPPSVDQAPRPPANWREILGSPATGDMGEFPPDPGLTIQKLGPTPPMGGGLFGSDSRGTVGDAARMAGIGSAIQRGGNNLGAALSEADRPKKGGFDWRMAAGILGDALMGLNGQAPIYAQNMWRMRQQQQEQNDRLAQMREQTRLKLTEPEYRSVNNRLVRFTPGTGESDVLYTAPQDFEDYAATLGAEPGTPKYDRLVQDYVLRGSGPTATDNYNIREDWRQENREELEGIRQNNRIGLQDRRQAGQRALKATPTYRQSNPLPPRTGRSGGGSGGGVREGQTATGPGGVKATFRSGQWMIQRGGQWVPIK